MTSHTSAAGAGASGAPALAGVLAAVAAGGALGACLRWGLSLVVVATPGGFPLATLGINVLGSLLIGILMTYLATRPAARPATPYLRPFLGVGVLGGFTTFSTYALDLVRLLTFGQVATALAYLVTTPVLAVAAAAIGYRWAERLFASTREDEKGGHP